MPFPSFGSRIKVCNLLLSGSQYVPPPSQPKGFQKDVDAQKPNRDDDRCYGPAFWLTPIDGEHAFSLHSSKTSLGIILMRTEIQAGTRIESSGYPMTGMKPGMKSIGLKAYPSSICLYSSTHLPTRPPHHCFSSWPLVLGLFDFFLTFITKIQTFLRILSRNSLLNLFHDSTVFINTLHTVNISIFCVITDRLFFFGHRLSPFIQCSFISLIVSGPTLLTNAPNLLLTGEHLLRKRLGSVFLLNHLIVRGFFKGN